MENRRIIEFAKEQTDNDSRYNRGLRRLLIGLPRREGRKKAKARVRPIEKRV